MEEVRLAVQRALDKLINRFGKESDVIGELRAALAALDKAEVPASVKVKEPVATPAPEPTIETASKKKAEPRPTARKSMGRKK